MTDTTQKGTKMISLKKKADLVIKKYIQINCGDMRELLEAHGRDSPLVRSAMNQRHYMEMSENDFLTILAFNAVLALEELQDVYTEQLRNGTFTPLNAAAHIRSCE